MTTHPAIIPNQLLPVRAGGRTHHPIADHIERIRAIHHQLVVVVKFPSEGQILLDTIYTECDGIIDELNILAAHNIFGAQP
jgi:hypothetical protein